MLCKFVSHRCISLSSLEAWAPYPPRLANARIAGVGSPSRSWDWAIDTTVWTFAWPDPTIPYYCKANQVSAEFQGKVQTVSGKDEAKYLINCSAWWLKGYFSYFCLRAHLNRPIHETSQPYFTKVQSSPHLVEDEHVCWLGAFRPACGKIGCRGFLTYQSVHFV